MATAIRRTREAGGGGESQEEGWEGETELKAGMTEGLGDVREGDVSCTKRDLRCVILRSI